MLLLRKKISGREKGERSHTLSATQLIKSNFIITGTKLQGVIFLEIRVVEDFRIWKDF